MKSQNQSVSLFATEKVDRVYIEKDNLVIKDMSASFVKFTNKHKSETQRTKHNLQTKILEISCRPGTVFKVPTVEQVRTNFGEQLQCFAFIQSARDQLQFYLILHFFNLYSSAAVSTLVNNLVHNMIKTTVVDPVLKFKQSHNTQLKKFVNDLTCNNVMFQHLIFYNFENQEEVKEQVETDKLAYFNNQFTKIYIETFKAICMFPMNYPQCQLYQLHEKDQQELSVYLRHNLLTYVKLSVMVTAYDIALEQLKASNEEDFSAFQSQFEEQLHKQTLMNQIVESTPSLTEQFIQSIFNRLKAGGNNIVKVIHPHPIASFSTHYQNYIKDGVFELLCYDPEYIIQILTVARWFAKVILQDEKVVAHDNNNCALFLYGTEGTGKSRIAKAFKDAFMAYNWFKGDYQSPDIVNGSCFYAEEVEFNYLITPLMKNILDFEASERVNIKNMHPIECSYMTPVMLTSNQYPQEVFQQHMQTNQKSKQSSAAGLMRRLFCVQFTQKFDDKYKNLEPSDDTYRQLQKVFLSSTKEQLFNTIYGLALMQADLRNIIAPPILYNYHNHVLESILQTHFGVFYYKNKQAIDQVITDYIQFINKYDVPQQQVNQNIESLKLTLRDMQSMYLTESIVNSNNPKGLFEIYRSVEKLHLRILRVLTQVPILNKIMKHEVTNNQYKQWEEYAIYENELNVLQSEEVVEDPFDNICIEIERICSTYGQAQSQPVQRNNPLLGKRAKIFQTDKKVKKRQSVDEFFNTTPKPTFEFEEINAVGWEKAGSLISLEDVKENLQGKFDE